MNKHILIVMSDSETPTDNGRMITALKMANNLVNKGAEVELYFDGKGVTWVPGFAERNENSAKFITHYGHYFDAVRDRVRVCNMCAKRFDVRERVSALDIPIMGEGHEHADYSEDVLAGATVVTF